MKFNYQARNKKGEVYAGEIEASSKDAAFSILREKDLFVTFLEESAPPIYARRITLFKGVSKKDLVLFSRQLSIMFKSKVLLTEALEVLSSEMKNIDFKEKIFKISEKVSAGTAFSEALSLYPKIFSPFYIAMVKSGEVSGKLSDVLNYLADNQEREYHLMSKAKGALVYPFLIVLVIFMVIGLLVTFVIPNLVGVLETGGQEIPKITQLVISGSAFLRNWGWLLLIGLGLLIFSCVKYYATEKGRKIFDGFFLKIPVFGPFLKMICLNRFAENLSTLVSGGLPIVQSLEVVADIIGNASYKEMILFAREEVKKGEMISSTLSRAPDLFPSVFVQMVSVGERTGTLDTTLMNIVDFYRQETYRGIDSVISVLEPVLIIFLGFIVGGIMISVLLPVYQTMGL